METHVLERAAPPEPLSLIQIAVEKGYDPAQLKVLVDLQAAVEAQQARKAFNVAMTACQSEMPLVVKDSENAHTRSRYAGLECVQRVARPVYTKHGFSVAFGTMDSPLAEHVRLIADVRHTQGHNERYQADIPLDGKGSQGGKSAMNAPQATGSTYSYGQRYLLKLIFNLTIADEDDDAQGADTGTIDYEQARELMNALKVRQKDVQKFLGWVRETYPNVKEVEEIPVAKWKEAMSMLRGGGK